jgi:hypothetical protein
MEKQQTAVEYLIEQLFPKVLSQEQYYHIEKAKEMEQQQIIDATTHENIRCTEIANTTLKILGLEPVFMVDDTWGKHYYNNTFKND